jgi:hypothetical protein
MIITKRLTNERPTDAEIGAFSNSIGGTLPDDYKSFLKNENGGRPKPKGFSYSTLDGRVEDGAVHYFFALYRERVGSLQKSFARFKKRMPAGYLPIGIDAFGNLIVLKTVPAEPGKIYFWDHEMEDDEKPPTLENMFLIANSFSEFVENLTSPEA